LSQLDILQIANVGRCTCILRLSKKRSHIDHIFCCHKVCDGIHTFVQVAEGEHVSTDAASQPIGSTAANQNIVAFVAQQGIVAFATQQQIPTSAACDSVIAATAIDVIAAAASGEAIVAVKTIDSVFAVAILFLAAVNPIVELRASQNVAAEGTQERFPFLGFEIHAFFAAAEANHRGWDGGDADGVGDRQLKVLADLNARAIGSSDFEAEIADGGEIRGAAEGGCLGIELEPGGKRRAVSGSEVEGEGITDIRFGEGAGGMVNVKGWRAIAV
jgi:hypothetical protein